MKVIRTHMPDGSVWDVPAGIVGRDRAKYYADKEKGKNQYEEELEYILSKDGEDDLLDWAANNMNWADVKEYAMPVPIIMDPRDMDKNHQEGWCNGEKEIVEVK